MLVDCRINTVKGITSGATEALGDIEMTGYGSNNLDDMVKGISSGATGALDDITMKGYGANDINGMSDMIKAGVKEKLDDIEMPGYIYNDSDTTLADAIDSGVTTELGEIVIDGYIAPPDTTAPTPSNASIEINNGDSTTNLLTVTLSISASDETGVTGYFASETNSAPDATADIWKDVSSDTSYSDNVTFYLSINNAVKTVYVWFKDAAGNISASSSDSITLIDWIAPKLPDTGQTTCYDRAGTVITCPAADQSLAQDGTYPRNPQSFTDNGDETITDNNTKLMWQKEEDNTGYNWYQATGTVHTTYNVGGAIDVCGNLTTGGYNDWRLPNPKELKSIVDHEIYNPSINQTYFPNTSSSDYWSATTKASSTSFAWRVSFGSGSVISYYKSSDYYVRCVRGGSESDIWSLVFSVIGDEVANHVGTNLMWQKRPETDEVPQWENAIKYCDALILGGYKDWRLPNVNELQTTIDYTTALNFDLYLYFINVGGHDSTLWTSTTYAPSKQFAYVLDARNGYVMYGKKGYDSGSYVRCVRGGQ